MLHVRGGYGAIREELYGYMGSSTFAQEASTPRSGETDGALCSLGLGVFAIMYLFKVV